MRPVIEIEGLSRNFGDLCAVDDLNLSIGTEIFGLLGPNGSGKTTTVLMLTTLLKPTAGAAFIHDHSCISEPMKVREHISYVPQEMAVDIKLTGRENVWFFAKMYGVPRPHDRVDEVLGILNLTDRADDLVKTYSGGMRRRLELAQALVHEPDVLFLDEPTIGLDVSARRNIWEHITRLRRDGMTVFVTTHYMDEADHACDRVGIIDHGRLVAVDTPVALKHQSAPDVVSVRISGAYHPITGDYFTPLGRDGEVWSFATTDGVAALPQIRELLEKAGNTIRGISLRSATLDDVFLQRITTQKEPEGFDERKFRTMLRRRR
ncbi:MAG TPA: ATP-binding cassette domain-containing protein [Methanospirillum sp.]|uniref:ABC transporter ATP-binding protein n=1 Tax=Methanospirillum sp. TaxID=45200 RepID=UPI002B811609|nr:ATP-binding cassette domain-containing protein [Methanospirillum sp.]HWQ64872.1 ATP-binding cassette domain-containing protein [Methanospirillum sp.]